LVPTEQADLGSLLLLALREFLSAYSAIGLWGWGAAARPGDKGRDARGTVAALASWYRLRVTFREGDLPPRRRPRRSPNWPRPRTDGLNLPAEPAGTALGFRPGGLEPARNRQIAELCIAAGADEALMGRWVAAGLELAARVAAMLSCRPVG
jgi:hypothetical protein